MTGIEINVDVNNSIVDLVIISSLKPVSVEIKAPMAKIFIIKSPCMM